MSHEISQIDIVTGTETFWHGLNEVHPEIKLHDPATCALARFEYIPQDLLLPNGNKSGFKVLTATDLGEDMVLGVPYNPRTYSLMTNEVQLRILEAICAKLDKLGVTYRIVSTGTIRERRQTFVSIEIDEASQYVVDGREFRNFLSMLNAIDKTMLWIVKNGSICVVCANTYNATLRDDSGAFTLGMKHCRSLSEQTESLVKDIPRLLECAIKGRDAMKMRLERWATFPVKVSEAEQVFAAFVGKDQLTTRSANIAQALATLFTKGRGNKGQTALDLFQAATEYYTHYSAGKSDDPTKQFESSEFGAGNDAKESFMQALQDMTESTDKFTGYCRIGDTLLINYRKGQIDKAKAK